jgi:cytochrome c peroxidase
MIRVAVLFAVLLGSAAAALPPVPVPDENPITEEKRILGKILFWDEQLSSDNSIACGTCHLPLAGGADPRPAGHPGRDGVLGTRDDTMGSPGIVHLGADGNRDPHPIFRTANQTTNRAAPSNFGGLWAETLFWDGRAGPAFVDPLTGETVIAEGGALEAQALVPLMNPGEMAHEGRTWEDLTAKLEPATPLALAERLPPDVADALSSGPSYPDLFAAAFGDPAITPTRIAFAIAAYQRTLVADRTPWDLAETGEQPLPRRLEIGYEMFLQQRCDACHPAPLFTTNEFFNVGLRVAGDDMGRAAVTGDPADAGRMKIPSLRNVGVRPRFMHTGEIATIEEALEVYISARAPRDELPGGGGYNLDTAVSMAGYLTDFLKVALTDPRVENEEFPFDRPRLRSMLAPIDFSPPAAPTDLVVEPADGGVRLTWASATDDTGVVDYVIRRDGAVAGYATETRFFDRCGAAGAVYAVTARDAPLNESEAARPPLGAE